MLMLLPRKALTLAITRTRGTHYLMLPVLTR